MNRRRDLLSEAEKQQILMSQNRFYKYWTLFWKYVYQLVSIVSYIAMLSGVVVAYYHSIINVDLIKALPAYLIVLLLIYVNKVNPS